MMINNLQNIVIVAGGENTRFKEMSIFPKVLLPTLDYPSILSYNCNLFKDYNIYLIINSRYYKMTEQYINKNQLNVKLINSNNHNGSANTIRELINELPDENILFVWSDLILDNNGLNSIINGINSIDIENIIFTYDGKYRFKATDNCIVSYKNGNVPGIYYCRNLSNIINNDKIIFRDNFDYLEIFKDYLLNDYKTFEYKGNILEFRDLETYIGYYTNQDLKTKTRFFNTMTINGNRLIKSCINKDYNKLIEREIDWYTQCKDNQYTNIPKIYNMDKETHTIEMEYLDGYENIYKFIQTCNDEQFNEFMDIYIKAVENLHSIKSSYIDKNQAFEDFRIEIYDKVIKRCNNISGILYKYDEDKLNIILCKAFDRILELNKNFNHYVFIHGDLNGSNVMYNKDTKDIKFIDPRGYFGNTKLLGPAVYDYAKIMYCLSGYDDFNNGRFKFTSNWYDKPKPLREYTLSKYENQELLYLIVGIIWVALAEYISQDVFKANIAYQHGLKLLEKYIK